jgi:dTDP-4-dehydrorhamnose reductase
MRSKVLILGSSGMAGHVITLMLRNDPLKYDVIDVSRKDSQIRPVQLLDMTDFGRLSAVIDESRPDTIINCVGLLNRYAEDHPDEAILANSYLPHFLEAVTLKTGARVIHISTDCVFSGKTGGYAETDFKDGAGFYAQTKALGELDNNKDLTIRTSIVGPELKADGTGLFHWFSSQRGEIKGYMNAFWSGVTTIELARFIVAVLEQPLTGIYHLVSAAKISKFDLLTLFKNEFGTGVSIKPDTSYTVDKSLINSRRDYLYEVPSYARMMNDMSSWIAEHRELYEGYTHLLSNKH